MTPAERNRIGANFRIGSWAVVAQRLPALRLAPGTTAETLVDWIDAAPQGQQHLAQMLLREIGARHWSVAPAGAAGLSMRCGERLWGLHLRQAPTAGIERLEIRTEEALPAGR